MKKIIVFLMALLFAVSVNAQTLDSRTFENVQVTVTGGTITSQHLGGQTFFWGGFENIVKGLRPVAGVEVAKYVTPVVGFGLEGLAMVGTTPTNTFISQSNIVGNLKLNLSNWFGGYLGNPRQVEFVLAPGLGWGHDYGEFYNDRNYLTYNIGAEMNVHLNKAQSLQLSVRPAVVWNNYNNVLVSRLHNMQARVLVGLTYKFKSKAKNSHNFVPCPYDVTTEEYEAAKARIAELEAREPEVKTVTVIKEVPTPVEHKIVLNNVTVYFDKGKSEISERELAHLDFFAQNADKNVPIKITGSADSATGSAERNAQLANQRAEAVKKVLVEKYGFDENKISIDTAQDLFDAATRSRVAVVE